LGKDTTCVLSYKRTPPTAPGMEISAYCMQHMMNGTQQHAQREAFEVEKGPKTLQNDRGQGSFGNVRRQEDRKHGKEKKGRVNTKVKIDRRPVVRRNTETIAPGFMANNRCCEFAIRLKAPAVERDDDKRWLIVELIVEWWIGWQYLEVIMP